jgi:hypothetical protein
MTLQPGDELTGNWAGYTITRLIGDAVWANGPAGTFLVPLATLQGEMSQPQHSA